MMIQTVIATGAEAFLNQALKLVSRDFSLLGHLDDKVILLDIQGFNIQLYLLPSIVTGFTVLSDYQGNPDATIQGLPFSLLRLLRQPAGTVSRDEDIVLQGDMDVIQGLMQVFRQLQVDWEEKLSQWIGDVPAHQLGRVVQQTQHYAQSQWQTGEANISEYLQEELKALPAHAEVQAFLDAVDVLRDDVERLEQRICLLSTQIYPLP
ncbi:hypothetical protein BegalDRAFT_0828 [Beggiatoa alba B18LD]|uniref:Ubiquinone biosynthesis accessory factor UbiJ n=1 Tax=Beggiatoa alba B18LD TaxID=395493 RepID=I3CDP6_9GAMM|nr:SCP2 sterol-binding domain-containing protein [Beggiatoa alba]EIJ41739.1 hypothetical protein BegalDRAFT_0828 [Beggiatoa alba B18LD]